MTALRLTTTYPLTTSDLEKSLHTIKHILELSNRARKEGLLSIEDIESDHTQPFLLRKGISLVVDGTDKIHVEEILSRYILSGQYNGYQLINRQIIMQGVLLIQCGEHPRLIQESLLSFLGESFYETALHAPED